jgi:hypothetical protein
MCVSVRVPCRASRVAAGATLAVALLFGTGAPLQAQLRPPRAIIGRVIALGGAAVSAAAVSLEGPAAATTLTAETDSLGKFEIQSPGGSGEYVLTVVAPGYRAIRRRIGNDDGVATLRVEVVLTPMSHELDAVKVIARPTAPAWPFVYDKGVGASESVAAGSRAALSPSDNEFTEILRTNLMVDPDGILGLPAAESQTQLNGLLFRGSALPRSTPVAIKAGTGEYDVSIGGFSSGRIAVELMPAGEFARRQGEVTTIFRRAAGTRSSVRGASTGTESSLDVGGTSRLGSSRGGISWGTRFARSLSENFSLAQADTALLANVGLTPAMLSDIEAVARERGLWGGAASRHFSSRTAASGVVRFDPRLARDRTNAWIVVGDLSESQPTLENPLAAPAQGSGSRSFSVTGQHLFRTVTDAGTAWDIRTGVSGSRLRSMNDSDASPSTVRVRTGTASVMEGGPSLILGGAPSVAGVDRAVGEVQAQRDWMNGPAGTVQSRLYLAARVDWYRRAHADHLRGLIDFPSIGALRTLDSGAVYVQEPAIGSALTERVSGGVSRTGRLGTAVRATGGVRADFQRLGSREMGQAWRQSLDLSPRLGLTWNFATPDEGPGYMQSNLESRQLVPPGVLRLGAGVFVADYAPEQALQPGGEPFRTTDVACVLRGAGDETDGLIGDLTPAALALACTDADLASDMLALHSTSRLGPGFRPPRSARVTASLVTRWRHWDITLDGVVARNDREPRVADAAIPMVPVMVLTDDADRPVFASSNQFEEADGRLLAGRLAGGSWVGRTLLVRSDGASLTRRGVLQVATRNGTRFPMRFGYAWSRTDVEEGGWDRDTFGSPWAIERGPSRADARHQFQFEVGRSLFGVSTSLWLRASSGRPFTPLIDGDVNGDGNAQNDRAVVPSLGDGGFLSQSVASLMEKAPSYVRRCLTASAGGPAGRGACTGPWTLRSALYVSFDPGVYIDHPLAEVTVVVENPISALSLPFGGARLTARSQSNRVDPVLFRVRGFDRSTSRFDLALNPGFGLPLLPGGFSDGGRRISVSVKVPLSRGIQRQQMDRWLASNGIGQGLDIDSLAARIARNVPNLYDGILESDELGLLTWQRDSLAVRRADLAAVLNEIWHTLARDLIQSGSRGGSAKTLARVQEATDRAWEASRLSANRLPEVLTPVQESLLPSPASTLVRARKPVPMRIIYY